MNETHPISIAIDGPSGAGKSTLARRLATTLRFLYVDTGAIYRTIAYYAYANHLDPADEAAVLAALPNIRIELCHDAEGLQRMILNGEDVTDAIRLPQISQYASVVSAYPGVGPFCWRCSGTLPGRAASSWMAGILAPWCCPRRT